LAERQGRTADAEKFRDLAAAKNKAQKKKDAEAAAIEAKEDETERIRALAATEKIKEL